MAAIDDFPTGKEFDGLVIATRIKEIKETIIDLTDSLESKEELWETWKTLNKAMSYLNAKHTMAEVKQKD